MKNFIVFDTSHNYTTFEMAREFLRRQNLPIVGTEPIIEIRQPVKKGNKIETEKNHNPFHFRITFYDEDVHSNVEAELYFTDYKLVLECVAGNSRVAEFDFDDKWQVFVAFELKGAQQAKYVKSIEEQMIKNLQLADKEFLDDASSHPEKEDDFADMHDYMVKETIIAFGYLKALEKNLGLLHEQAYNPFAHPYINPKAKEPRLVDIVASCNQREKDTGQYNVIRLARDRFLLEDQEKESV